MAATTKPTSTNPLQGDGGTAAETLDVLTEDYVPAENTNLADQEVSSLELQSSIAEHTGEAPPLADINKYMKEKGFRTRSNSRMEIVWMMARVRP